MPAAIPVRPPFNFVVLPTEKRTNRAGILALARALAAGADDKTNDPHFPPGTIQDNSLSDGSLSHT